MSKVLLTDTHLEDIADAIRGKLDVETTYRPGDMAAAIRSIPTGGDVPTGTRQITQNGTYDVIQYASANVQVLNTYEATDEGKVVSNGALVAQTSRSVTQNGTYDTTENDEVVVNVSGGTINLQSKTATQNGTVTPDAGYDGLSSVVVNVSGGGGGNVVLLSRATWDALTTAEKRAYGLVAIQDAVTGFLRGDLVNGADYIPLGIYLPYSNESDIICEAYQDNYDAANTEWGVGSNPIQLSAAGSAQNEDGSVTILTKTNGVLAYVDLGATGTTFTAYIVAKVRSANSNFTRILSCMASRSMGQGIMLYGTAVNVSSWASDTSTGISASAYFVGAIQFGGAGSALGSAIASASSTPTMVTKTPSNAGRYLTIGRTDINPDGNNAEPTDMDVLYLGVSSVAESQSVVTQNMQYLASQFLS